MYWLLALIIVFIISYIYFKWFKIPKLKNVVFIDGSLGTGKSALSVCLAVRLYKRAFRHHKYRLFLSKVFKIKKWENDEEPILYSNIKLRGVKYSPIDKSLLLRKDFRFAYKSVMLLDEFSLIADQQMYGKRYEEICERMNEFFKLFRHETKGGYLIINSQSTSDLNYTLKSVLSDYFYIHHKSNRFVPFICTMQVQECRFSRDNSSLQVNIEDVEENLKTLVMLKKWFRYYDTYCHSIFTDMLPVYRELKEFKKGDSLKSDILVSYKDLTYLYENINKYKESEVKEIEKEN